jgi:TPP-dependent pyruvate/acetoin dehydrogenase alpha subunit
MSTSKARRNASGAKSDLSLEQLKELFYWLKLNRMFDERLASLYRRGKVPGAVYASTGQEAISIGASYALKPEDVVGPLIRNSGTILHRGVTPREYFANFCGRVTGPTRGKDGNNHLGDLKRGVIAPISMLGSMIPTLVGCALAFKMRRERRVALTFIGDGGTSTGEFHEGINMAAVMKVPFVLIIENNGYAYSTPVANQTLVKNLIDKAPGYGMAGEVVDGNDVVAVYATVHAAVERARDGGGPTLIEAKTMRMKGHAEHDDASYVPKGLFESWRDKDPVERQAKLLRELGVKDAELAAVEERVKRELDEAEEQMLADPLPEAQDAERGVWA